MFVFSLLLLASGIGFRPAEGIPKEYLPPFLYLLITRLPVTVAAQSKAQVCGSSPAENVGSNTAEALMSVCCDLCVLSGRGLCDELIKCPEESYRLWCVVVCDLETSLMRRPQTALSRGAPQKSRRLGALCNSSNRNLCFHRNKVI